MGYAKREDLKPGMLVYVWHDTVVFGVNQMYADVIRVNRVTATVRWLRTGNTRRVPLQDLMIAEFPDEIRSEEPATVNN